jgi:peptidoglycan/xylan/chitin deacetylase (PgdA/CDA1 family)
MYHVINSPPTDARFPGLYVTPRQFSAQMEALARASFTGVTLNQVEANWKQGAPLPAGRPVVISFDNGYRTQFTRAFPLLRKLGWPAVENLQLEGLPPSQGGLTPREIRALVGAGWELDTQGFTHADLTRLGPQQLLHEVSAARVAIRRRYQTPADWFAYPSGHYDATVITAVKAAGYIGATTVVAGWADPRDDPYALPRFRILAGTTPQGLLAQLADGRHTPDPPSSYL